MSQFQILTSMSAMATLSDDDWRLVETAYRDGDETLGSLSQRFGVAASTISRRAKRCGWRRRQARAVASEPTLVPTPADAGVDKRELVVRFYRLIKLKLEQMEEDMARGGARPGKRTPADSERETRALGTLIRNFEKVFGLERQGGSDGEQEHGGSGSERRAEAEAIRRELAERLVRLRETKQ